MKLTTRGEALVGTFALAFIVAMLFVCFTVGQQLKHNRLTESGLIPPISCQEDEPCWDCTSMGNKECGP